MVANGWSTRANAGPTSRTSRSSAVAARSVSITAATSGRALTGSPASILARSGACRRSLHGQLVETSAILGRLRQQVNALALNEDLRMVLREEQDWLTRAQLAVSEVRSFREQDMLRFWPAVLRRWAVALVFALASAAAAGGLFLVDEAVRCRTRGSSLKS